MLSEVIKKYEGNKKQQLKSAEATRSQIEEAIEAKTIRALKVQNHKVSKIHSNQQEIENRLKRNAELSAQLKAHTNAWCGFYEAVSTALKEAGDLVHYSNYVHEEVRQINQLLHAKFASQENDQSNQKQKCAQTAKQEQVEILSDDEDEGEKAEGREQETGRTENGKE